jgi:hypothetical protein
MGYAGTCRGYLAHPPLTQTVRRLDDKMVFLVFASFQLLLALMTLFAPGRLIFALGFIGNLMLLITSIGSQLLGLPFGAHPSTPHILGSAEMSVLIMEILGVARDEGMVK